MTSRNARVARSLFAIATFAMSSVVVRAAQATTTEECVSSATEADRLRRDPSAFRAARDRLQVCASDECPELIRQDCRVWLSEVEDSIPTVVLIAEGETGAPLLETRVEVDGVPLDQPLDGRPLVLDVGVHTFKFYLQGQSIERTTVLVARQKNAMIRVRFGSSAPTEGREPIAAPRPSADAPRAVEPANEAPRASSTLLKIGLTAAAAGVISLAFGTFFGLRAAAKQDSANCPDNVCGPNSRPDELHEAKIAGNWSTGLFIAGGALTATGVGLFFMGADRGQPSAMPASPSPPPSPSRSALAVRPFGLGLKLELQAF